MIRLCGTCFFIYLFIFLRRPRQSELFLRAQEPTKKKRNVNSTNCVFSVSQNKQVTEYQATWSSFSNTSVLIKGVLNHRRFNPVDAHSSSLMHTVILVTTRLLKWSPVSRMGAHLSLGWSSDPILVFHYKGCILIPCWSSTKTRPAIYGLNIDRFSRNRFRQLTWVQIACQILLWISLVADIAASDNFCFLPAGVCGRSQGLSLTALGDKIIGSRQWLGRRYSLASAVCVDRGNLSCNLWL